MPPWLSVTSGYPPVTPRKPWMLNGQPAPCNLCLDISRTLGLKPRAIETEGSNWDGEWRGSLRRGSPISKELFDGQLYVLGNLTQEDRRDITALMKGNGRTMSVRMPELPMGTALTDFDEPQGFQNGDYLTGFQNGNGAHDYATTTLWVPTNSASRCGSPSSRSMLTTSRRFRASSSKVSPGCARRKNPEHIPHRGGSPDNAPQLPCIAS